MNNLSIIEVFLSNDISYHEFKHFSLARLFDGRMVNFTASQ